MAEDNERSPGAGAVLGGALGGLLGRSSPSTQDQDTPFAREWVQLQSSNVAAMKYDPRDMVLHLRFVNGREHSYEDVPAEVADGLMTAESPGKYVWAHIRGKFKEPWR